MKYPCGIIKDLLPLYIDDVANDESKIAVKNHLEECESCKRYYETMSSTDDLPDRDHDDSEDKKMADSLKNIKIRINKKIRNIVLCSVSTVLLLICGFNLLFNIPVKNIALDDITVSVSSYPMEEIANVGDAECDPVVITVGETDESQEYRLAIPEMPSARISVSENTMKRDGFVSVVTWSCPYQIRQIVYEDKTDDNTVYVKALKTTVFNNKTEGSQQSLKSLEFRDINKIVFVDNGQEKVLWSK